MSINISTMPSEYWRLIVGTLRIELDVISFTSSEQVGIEDETFGGFKFGSFGSTRSSAASSILGGIVMENRLSGKEKARGRTFRLICCCIFINI